MREPIEYLGNVNAFTTREELYNIGKQMQMDAWNEAINDVANTCEDYPTVDEHGEPTDDIISITEKEDVLKLLKS